MRSSLILSYFCTNYIKSGKEVQFILYSLNPETPIAVIDSGVGGISVLRELVKIMPNEDFIYFGDSANAPYGTKELEEVRNLTIAAATQLFSEGCKGLVVACNTATSAAVRLLRKQYPEIPIVGIEPAVKPAVASKDHPRVLIMATPMTIHQEKLQLLMDKYEKEATLIPLPCPGLMDFVERGDLDGPDLMAYLEELLYPYKKEKVDAVVLGCTHYPFVKNAIAKVLGNNVAIFDGGEGTAREMKRRLSVQNLLSEKNEKGQITFRNSLPGNGKEVLCEQLFTK